MRILKGFKSCVLEVRILKKLEARFSEVRILRDLGEKQLKVDPSTALRARRLKLKRERFGELNTETQRSETETNLEIGAGRDVGLVAIIGAGSMVSDYCQDIVLYLYHSNETRGS